MKLRPTENTFSSFIHFLTHKDLILKKRGFFDFLKTKTAKGMKGTFVNIAIFILCLVFIEMAFRNLAPESVLRPSVTVTVIGEKVKDGALWLGRKLAWVFDYENYIEILRWFGRQLKWLLEKFFDFLEWCWDRFKDFLDLCWRGIKYLVEHFWDAIIYMIDVIDHYARRFWGFIYNWLPIQDFLNLWKGVVNLLKAFTYVRIGFNEYYTAIMQSSLLEGRLRKIMAGIVMFLVTAYIGLVITSYYYGIGIYECVLMFNTGIHDFFNNKDNEDTIFRIVIGGVIFVSLGAYYAIRTYSSEINYLHSQH